MKTTKKQAMQAYDDYFGVMRCLNGGTREENERMASHCYERLCAVAEGAAVLAANPSKRLSEDAWLTEALNEVIPNRLKSFRARYFDHLSPEQQITGN